MVVCQEEYRLHPHPYFIRSDGGYFGPTRNSNFTFGSTTEGYNFLEDFDRFDDPGYWPKRTTGNPPYQIGEYWDC